MATRPPLVVGNDLTVAKIKIGDAEAMLLLLRFKTVLRIGEQETETPEIALSIQAAAELAQELGKRVIQARQIAQAEGLPEN